ncbi:MAG: phosphatase PAP2 family protein [Ignavibacteria bacterium]|nr:phosphatase PAP2 family protein [Ignavibacteria bacterium]
MKRISFCFLLIMSLSASSLSQDTINFKLFDSLKTKTEDEHKSVIVDIKDPDNSDVKLFRIINNSRSNFKNDFFNVFDRSMLPVTLLMPASIFIYGRSTGKTYDENSAYLLSGAIVTDAVLTLGVKFISKRPRPKDRLYNIYTREELADRYSFPSGHTGLSFASATMFALRYPKYPQVYAPIYAWALLIAYGRPYFGMHYPTDLLAGAVIGTGSSVLIYSLRKELFRLKNNVFGENKIDEGSLNGGTVSFFLGSFAVSALVNAFIIRNDNKIKLYTVPGSGGFNVNLNYMF